MAKQKPANRAGKLTLGYHRPRGTVSGLAVGPGWTRAATVLGIRAVVVGGEKIG